MGKKKINTSSAKQSPGGNTGLSRAGGDHLLAPSPLILVKSTPGNAGALSQSHTLGAVRPGTDNSTTVVLREEILSLSAVDIWGRITLPGGGHPAPGRLLSSPDARNALVSPSRDNHKCAQTLPDSPSGEKHSFRAQPVAKTGKFMKAEGGETAKLLSPQPRVTASGAPAAPVLPHQPSLQLAHTQVDSSAPPTSPGFCGRSIFQVLDALLPLSS